MQKKITIITILLLVFCGVALPEHIEPEAAEIAAYNWTEILRTEFGEEVTIAPGSCRVITKNGNDTAFVFDFTKKGFVVISGEDVLPTVKFYTTSFDFGEHNRALRFQDKLLNELESAIIEVRERKLEKDEDFGRENREFFRYLRGYHKSIQGRSAAKKEEVELLIRTRWGQTGAENLKCPVIDGYRAPSGCVANAIAQIMRYHEWPIRGRGSHSYNLYGYDINLSANFDHVYDWDNLLDFYQHENVGTQAEREAISTLMYDVGIAIEMYYTPYWSSADPKNAVDALPRYFKYSPDIQYVNRYFYSSTADEWFGVAKEQIDQGLPIAFTIYGDEGGHEVLIDGYRIYNQSKTVHINFGWRGMDDGYYAMESIPDFGRYEYQRFLLNIKPPHYRHIKAPSNISAIVYENRSLLMTEFHIQITWDATPTGEENIEKYILYRKERKLRTNKTAHYEKVGEVAAGGERVFRFVTPHFDQWEYDYTVIAADAKGNKSKNPRWIKVEQSSF
ncbi:C10 family peptidase [Acidobacteriota bacterium]